MNTHDNLNAEELLHLAIKSISRDDSEGALVKLKRSLELDANSAHAHFLLGTQYADIGMIPRALEEMQAALDIDPNMQMARFQLGLLQMTIGATEEGSATWAPFEELVAEHPLRLFAYGIQHMVRDEFDMAKRLLTEGIARNVVNPALNRDMAVIVGRIDELLNQPPPDAQAAQEQTQHLGVSAYQEA
jgi:tetratricopeptide (TPR) repeat protein